MGSTTRRHRRTTFPCRRSKPAARAERGRERARHPRADVVLLPVLWLSRRAGAVFAAGRRLRRCLSRRRLAGGDHAEDFRRRRFRGAAGDPVLPSGRRAHEFGQRGGADRQPFGVAGRAYQGRAVAGRRRLQHVLFGNVAIAGLFMAGVVPGFMIGIGLMIYCYFFGPSGMRKPRAPLRQVMFATADAALPLMIPVILLGGILTGWFTPTEAGVVAVIWIIAVVIP